jgi:hypothetical protein
MATLNRSGRAKKKRQSLEYTSKWGSSSQFLRCTVIRILKRSEYNCTQTNLHILFPDLESLCDIRNIRELYNVVLYLLFCFSHHNLYMDILYVKICNVFQDFEHGQVLYIGSWPSCCIGQCREKADESQVHVQFVMTTERLNRVVNF